MEEYKGVPGGVMKSDFEVLDGEWSRCLCFKIGMSSFHPLPSGWFLK